MNNVNDGLGGDERDRVLLDTFGSLVRIYIKRLRANRDRWVKRCVVARAERQLLADRLRKAGPVPDAVEPERYDGEVQIPRDPNTSEG